MHGIAKLNYIIVKFSKSFLKSKNNNTKVHHLIRLVPRHLPLPQGKAVLEVRRFMRHDLKAAEIDAEWTNSARRRIQIRREAELVHSKKLKFQKPLAVFTL